MKQTTLHYRFQLKKFCALKQKIKKKELNYKFTMNKIYYSFIVY